MAAAWEVDSRGMLGRQKVMTRNYCNDADERGLWLHQSDSDGGDEQQYDVGFEKLDS